MTLQTALSNLISEHHDQPAWWYGVHYDANSPHSLCSLLGIEPDSYPRFLEALGLVDGRGFMKSSKTEQLASSLVDCTSWQWFKKKPAKKQIFIRIGIYPTNKKYYPKDPHEQFAFESLNASDKKKVNAPKHVPRAKAFFMDVWDEYKRNNPVDKNDINKTKNTAKAKNNNNIPFVVTPAKTQEVGDPKKQSDKEKILDILGRELLSKLFDEEALTNVVAIFQSSLTVDEVLNSVATTHIQVQEERENLLQKKKRALLHATRPKELNADKSRFPYMLSKGIDVTNSDHISRLLREVSKLQRDILVSSRDVDIFKFLQHNEKTTTLVRVPTNTTMKHFETNLTSNSSKSRGGYNFVFRVLDAMLPQQQKVNDTNDNPLDHVDEEAVDHDRTTVKWTQREHAAEGLIVYLGKRFGAAFVKAADVLGMPVVKKKERMDVATSAAMCDDAGLSNSQMRVVNKYAMFTLGHPLTAPESKMRALGKTAILPVCAKVIIKQECCSYFKKDPVEVIEKKLQEVIEPNPNLKWDRLDIIFGGDHGQGAFRVPVKLLLKDEKQEVKIEIEYNIAEVECKKDTSEVLRGTIFPYLNERLKTIIRYERCPITNEITSTRDGSIFEYHRVVEEKVVSRFSFQDDVAKEGEELVRAIPFTFIVTGDLAFYAVILGMKNAAGFHCHLCRLKKTDWEKHPQHKGAARTMQWLLETWPKAREAKGGRISGVVEKPLMDAIDPSRFVVPPLHSMLGIGNSILNDFKIFIDLLLEDAPSHLKSLRNNEMLAEIKLSHIRQEIASWGTINGPALAECHEKREELTTLRYSMLEAGEGTEEETAAISDELDEVHERLAALNEGRENLVVQETILSTEWKRKKAKLSAFLKCKKNKKYTKSVKSRFEDCLRRFGIDYAAYHGGDLVGNDCRKLMSRAEDIMDEVEAVLQAVAIEKQKGDETKEAISCRCRAIRDALVVFDSVFAIMFKPNAKVRMERDLPELKKLLEKALLAWTNLKDKNERGVKNITPKVHGLVHHLADQFELYGGIGDYDEQFVERNHQTGKKDRKRSSNMRDCGTRYKSIAFWEERRKNRDVIARGQVVHKSRKRNFKGERKATSQEEAKEQRQISRRRIVDGIQLRDLSNESARILAMNELKEYNPPEEEIDYNYVEDGEGGGGTMDDDDDDDDSLEAIGTEDI